MQTSPYSRDWPCLALLAHAFVPKEYWPEAFSTAVYLINRLPTPVLHGKMPFESLFGQSPDYHFLRVFGSACWLNLCPFNKHKLNYCSALCIFLGYSPDHKGYRCLHRSTCRIYISHDVHFDEQFFPFQLSSSPRSLPNSLSLVPYLPFPLTGPIDVPRVSSPVPLPISPP